MLLWFAVVMVLFAVGDVVAKLTKARISSVFATLMLFLVLFVAGVLPADIIEKAGLSAASSWSVPMLLFAMGSMINLRQFMDEWRTVVTCWFGMLAVIIGVSLTIPIIGKEMALSAIPAVSYTHLDVYKRQSLRLSTKKMGTGYTAITRVRSLSLIHI